MKNAFTWRNSGHLDMDRKSQLWTPYLGQQKWNLQHGTLPTLNYGCVTTMDAAPDRGLGTQGSDSFGPHTCPAHVFPRRPHGKFCWWVCYWMTDSVSSWISSVPVLNCPSVPQLLQRRTNPSPSSGFGRLLTTSQSGSLTTPGDGVHLGTSGWDRLSVPLTKPQGMMLIIYWVPSPNSAGSYLRVKVPTNLGSSEGSFFHPCSLPMWPRMWEGDPL